MRNLSKSHAQNGFSLIELLVAILISTILLLGVLTLFTNTTDQDRTNNALARVQESARIGIQLIQRDLRRTSFLGCSSSNQPTPTGTPSDAEAAITDFLDAMITGTDGGAGSDSLTTNHAISIGATNSISASGAELASAIQATQGDTFIVSDCTNLAIIHQSSTGETSNLTPSGNEYDPSGIAAGSGVWQMNQITYDIRDTGRTNNGGQQIRALYANGAEIIEGAEDLQILYGITSSGNTTWMSADSLNSANRSLIDRIKISLVVASPDTNINAVADMPLAVADLTNPVRAAANDGRLRRVFHSTIDLRNRSYLRN